jgi:lipopolysaccharide export system permease protein
MVFTLQRYIFRELFKVFALATIGLTLVLSLGGILQPVQEYGVGPRQVVHILIYFIPITLTFVLPMAALFASALTYGRFASDNELDACRASGVSLFTMVYPGWVLAILVATANLVLSFHVMPYFVHLAEKSLKADAKQIVFRNIERRGFYELPPDGRSMIYADHADVKTDTLSGIVVVQNDKGSIKTIITADAARIHFEPHENFNEVRLDVFGARRMGAADDLRFEIGRTSVSRKFGSLLGDDIKFKRVNEMKQIRADLMRFNPIAEVALTGFAQLATELLAQDISAKITAAEGDLYELRGNARFVRFSATSCALEEEKEVGLGGRPVLVKEYDSLSGRLLRTLRCDSRVVILLDEDPAGPGLSLHLYNAKVETTGQIMVHHTIDGLAMPEVLAQRLHRASLLETVTPDEDGGSPILKGSPSSTLAGQQRDLVRIIQRTLVDIKAEMNSRLVFGIGCIPMIMIGIGLGIINRGGHLLSAFGASCIPAAVLIVAIISGKHVTENMTAQGVSGIVVMWAGLGCLTVLAVWIYARLSRS